MVDVDCDICANVDIYCHECKWGDFELEDCFKPLSPEKLVEHKALQKKNFEERFTAEIIEVKLSDDFRANF